MGWIRRHPLLVSLLAVLLLVTLVIGGSTIFMAEQAGLEWRFWEPEPTLIPVTPFSDFPGFGASSTPAAGWLVPGMPGIR